MAADYGPTLPERVAPQLSGWVWSLRKNSRGAVVSSPIRAASADSTCPILSAEAGLCSTASPVAAASRKRSGAVSPVIKAAGVKVN